MKNLVLLTILSALVCVSGCNSNSGATNADNFEKFDTSVYGGVNFHVETIQLETGFGYSVSINDKKVIVQKNIPAVEGNLAFKTKEDALKVGKLVAKKMIHFPGDLPSVTKEELKELKVIE
ncbi:MAG: DUF4907 domain-containing protein [Bacteroidales bacterium]|nr:DUF4907 domain-containing protein [Bacteroidales bacterium]